MVRFTQVVHCQKVATVIELHTSEECEEYLGPDLKQKSYPKLTRINKFKKATRPERE